MSEIIDKLKETLDEPPYVYSDDELRELGIDPKLFVFMSRPDFSDNSFALWEYINRHADYKTAWLLLQGEHSAKLTKKGIVNAVWNTPEGQSLARTAKYFVNTIHSSYVSKYPGQIFVNLWHGTGVKATDFLAFDGDNTHLLKTKRVVDDTDLFLVHSNVDKINMAAEFSCDARRFVATGQPRLDRVRSTDGRANIKKLFNGVLAGYDKIVMYAPTARITSFSKVGEFFDSNIFNLEGYDKPRLDNLLKQFNAALVIKLHPIEKDKFNRDDMQLGDNSFLMNDNDLFYADLQMNDILNAFDVMIGDYSSIITDYLALDRPVIYSIGDFEEYSTKEGFVYNDVSFYMPGEKATNFDSLMVALEDAFMNPDRHSEWRKNIYRQKSSFMDDNACERALRAIENYKPLTNYDEAFFIKKTLLPVAEQYEEKLKAQEDRLWDYENRISSAVAIIEKALPQDSVIETVLSTLSTPVLSHAEQNILNAKNALESICDEILEGYAGEYVFFSLPQRWGWTGKTRTAVQQYADHIAKMGHLFLVGETKDVPFKELLTVLEAPSFRKLSERLIILDYCHYTEIVLKKIILHGKKIVFVVPSDFFTTDGKAMESGVSLAYKTIYFYRYNIKNYLGKKDYNELDISRWEALQYACRNEKVNIVVSNELLYDLVREETDSNKILFQALGVDYDMFAKNMDAMHIPEKLKAIKATGSPVFGYCGTIDARLYFSVIHYVCGKCKDYQFVFIGANRIRGTWGHVFEDYPNIHLLDEADYASMPSIINAFDVAIIPYFKSVRMREPAKLFEYFACEKPIVTTDMQIGEKYKHIFMGSSHGDFVNCLDKAFTAKDDTTMKTVSDSIAKENDWMLKAKEILHWIGL